MKQFQCHCIAGDEFTAAGSYEAAISRYNAAWELVPEPKIIGTRLRGFGGDRQWWLLGGFRTSALEALQYAMICPNVVGNSFLYLRLGQVLFDREECEAAADELMRHTWEEARQSSPVKMKIFSFLEVASRP